MDRGIDREDPVRSGPWIPETKSPADFFFLLRPMILIPVWTFFLLGARHGSVSSGNSVDPVLFFIGIASFSSLVAAAYVINQITDRETDRVSGKLFLISHGVIPIPAAWITAGILASAAILSAALLMPRGFLFVLIAGGSLGIAYSIEPIRLKRRPVFDVMANAIANGVLNTLAGWTAVGVSIEGISILAPYPLAVAAVHLSTTLADIEGDRRSGLRTSGVILGQQAGIVLSTLLMAASLAISAVTHNVPALYASTASLPFFIAAAVSWRKRLPGKRILLPAKISTAAYSITACFFYPAYIPMLVIVVLITRLYYKKRFGINYPSF